jgi:Cu-processing system permease protein
MHRIYAIAINTFREAVRDRVLLGAFALASLVLLFTLALAELSLDQQARVVTDVGLATISLFSVLVAVFLGSSLLYKEIERKTLYVILPRPIHRYEFLLGKYFGIVLTVLVLLAIAGALLLWVMSVERVGLTTELLALPPASVVLLGLVSLRARDRTAILVPWAAVTALVAGLLAARAGVSLGPVIAALVLVSGEIAIIGSVALLFSSFSTPFLTGAFTLGVWVVGRSASTMVAMQGRKLPEELKALLAGIVRVAPNLSLYVPPRHTLEATSDVYGGPLAYVATSMGYAALYSAVLLVLASLIFRRRDFL